MPRRGAVVKREPERKRVRYSERVARVDRISQLPNCVLLYIMTFLTTKEAVQTCALSTRWKDLWKSLPNLMAFNTEFEKAQFFKTFVNKVLTHRDRSTALRCIDVDHNGFIPFQMLSRLFKYAMSHSVEQFTFNAASTSHVSQDMVLPSSMLSGRSLKYLDLTLRRRAEGQAILPPTLDLPELIGCYLKDVAFSSKGSDYGNGGGYYAEPFSGCKKLRKLVIHGCTLHKANILYVFSDKLAKLNILSGLAGEPCKVQMRTPNLKQFIFVGLLTTDNFTHQLFEHDLNFLEEVVFEVWSCWDTSVKIAENLKNCLKKFSNVNKLTLASSTLKVLSFNPGFPKIERARFGNLMKLVMTFDPPVPLTPDMLGYILEGTPCRQVLFPGEDPYYYDRMETEDSPIRPRRIFLEEQAEEQA